MKNKDIIERILELGTSLAFGALVVNVTIQVVTRFLIPSVTVVWTEEASRFLFIYSVVFAAPLAMKKREYVNVDMLLNIMPKGMRKAIELLIQIASIGLFGVVFIKGIEFAKLGMGQTSATLGIPMYRIYSSIAITSFFIMIYGIYNFVSDIRGMRDRGDRT
ncbi:TRAP transporter small permease [Geosporobacter ferrireducens]|uniref:Tripartite ATP-independent periplasmic transporters DctQ component domain-containing protein n=1 Tax=Geosporobacter ferrireducens TaxID=1424294 RepID=A0A1D8GIF8_9FIRM|nr:TRAP transporter small permease [Geosporobacter ferrireducens]AOT70713.1 hypothetical protein Gferi_14695 [Geosporobacter ferrireducens]MTI57520.1 TRAP transporter small permease [Geosporobacter ferrireducens]